MARQARLREYATARQGNGETVWGGPRPEVHGEVGEGHDDGGRIINARMENQRIRIMGIRIIKDRGSFCPHHPALQKGTDNLSQIVQLTLEKPPSQKKRAAP